MSDRDPYDDDELEAWAGGQQQDEGGEDPYDDASLEQWASGDDGAGDGRPDRIAVNVTPRPPAEDDDGFMQRLMAFGDGLAGNWGGELAGMLSRGSPGEGESTERLKDEIGYDPDYQAQRVDSEVTRASQDHPYYNAGGQITRGLGAAALAGPGIMAQTAMGAADSAAAEYGDSHSAGKAVGRGIVGGGLSGAAATAGKVLGRVLAKKPGAAPAAASADDLVMPQASAPAPTGQPPIIDVPLAPRAAPRAPQPPLSPGDPELPHVLSQRDRIHSLDDVGAIPEEGTTRLGLDDVEMVPDEATSQIDLDGIEELAHDPTRAAPYAPGEATSAYQRPLPDGPTGLYEPPQVPGDPTRVYGGTRVGPGPIPDEATRVSQGTLPDEPTRAAKWPSTNALMADTRAQNGIADIPDELTRSAPYAPGEATGLHNAPAPIPGEPTRAASYAPTTEGTQASYMPQRPGPAEQTQAAYMPPPPPPPGPMPRPPGPTSYLPNEPTRVGERVRWQPPPRQTGYRPNEQTQVMGAPQGLADQAVPPPPPPGPPPPPPPPPPVPGPAPEAQPGKYDRAIELAMKYGRASPQMRALVAGGQALGKAMDPSRVSNPYASPGAIGGMEVAAEGLAGLYRDQKPAPANKTTVNFAIKKLLTDSKGAGLTDKDTADLMTTFQEGDQAGIATKLWTLGQKNPLFKKKYEEVLTTVGGGHR